MPYPSSDRLVQCLKTQILVVSSAAAVFVLLAVQVGHSLYQFGSIDVRVGKAEDDECPGQSIREVYTFGESTSHNADQDVLGLLVILDELRVTAEKVFVTILGVKEHMGEVRLMFKETLEDTKEMVVLDKDNDASSLFRPGQHPFDYLS